MGRVLAVTATLRFWAAAREAAGAAEETVGAGTLAEALDEAVRRRGGERGGGAELRRVLSRSSVLLNGVQVGRADPRRSSCRTAPWSRSCRPSRGLSR